MHHEVLSGTRAPVQGCRLPELTLLVLDLLAGGASRETTARRTHLPYSRVMAIAAAHGWPDRVLIARSAREGRAGLPVAAELRGLDELVAWAESSGIEVLVYDARRIRAHAARLRRRIERQYARAARASRAAGASARVRRAAVREVES